jgi:serine/threonine protein kinase
MVETSKFTLKSELDDDMSPQSVQFVANGSTSTCYLMRYHGKLVFEKRLKSEYESNGHYVANFRKEFEVGFNLDNDSIVRYIALKEDDRGVFILTDYVKGCTLTDFVTRNPDYFNTTDHRRAFLKQLFSAIECLHNHQILHLDLKPDNVMMTDVGHHVKLIDLGFCYQDSFPFGTGGTKGFSSPEQFTKEFPLSAASDIYALGRILDFLHIGSKRIIAKCTRNNPKERYQSVGELSRAIGFQHNLIRYALFAACLLAIAAAVLFIPYGRGGQNLSDKVTTTINGAQSGITDNNGQQTGQQASAAANRDSLIKNRDNSQTVVDAANQTKEQTSSAPESATQQIVEKQSEKLQKVQEDDMNIYKKKLDVYYAPVRHLMDSSPKFDPSSKEDHYTQFSRQYKKVMEAAKQKSQNDPFCQRCRRRFKTVFDNYESKLALSIDDRYLEVLHRLNDDE